MYDLRNTIFLIKISHQCLDVVVALDVVEVLHRFECNAVASHETTSR